MARCNKTAYAILGFISKRPMSGYDIKKVLERTSKWYWAESNAQIYPILKRMEEKGCLESHVDETSGARKRRIYQITEKGLDKLKTWLLQPVEPSTYRNEFILKINMGQHLSKEQLVQQVEHFHERIQKQVKEIQEIRNYIEEEHKDRPDYPYLMMTYGYATEVWNTKAAWCEKTLAELQETIS